MREIDVGEIIKAVEELCIKAIKFYRTICAAAYPVPKKPRPMSCPKR